MCSGISLSAQLTAVAAMQRYAYMSQVFAEHFGLAHTIGAENIVVVCTERGLAMSNQIDATHARRPGTLKVTRG
jgi:hypothetical protein